MCGTPPADMESMDIDWPGPKRRRLESDAEDDNTSTTLWSLRDALLHYASIAGCDSVVVPATPTGPGTATVQPATPTGTASSAVPKAVHDVPVAEPLLRALTQLANVAARDASVRRKLVAEHQVHAPLLRLMQGPLVLSPLVAMRCCRLVHWLCVGAPENRDVLVAPGNAGTPRGRRIFVFVDAILRIMEAHAASSEVLKHSVRALSSLLPCPRLREEVLRARPRLIDLLGSAVQSLDPAAENGSCRRWLPGLPGFASRRSRQASYRGPGCGNGGGYEDMIGARIWSLGSPGYDALLGSDVLLPAFSELAMEDAALEDGEDILMRD
eukprot:gnl/MRDRNA2_/MRDRNA2_106688_c0_seq1.p1 gnl/MRDRNA2_/MRDRNA2_106688_c0~~gnl/MRDRNA2_/MRDRNA2_106688_c0_seq1.p1  ORF type:complete len:326 (+),score=52.91 gnl/MRDRNA2_/MRDRNA2_106688_c0_seq1:107-1084(+)